jgi:hypothetical protein
MKNLNTRHTGIKNLRNYQHSYNGYSVCTFQSRVEGADSVVGTTSLYCLDVSGFEPRLGQDFLLSTPVKTGPGVHPSSCAMGNRASSRRQSVRDLALTLSLSSAKARACVKLYIHALSMRAWNITGIQSVFKITVFKAALLSY